MEYKYGVVIDREVTVFNKRDKSMNFIVRGSHILEDVKVEVKDKRLIISGKKIIYDLYFRETPESEWENEPEESQIQVKTIGIFKKREIRFLRGLVRTKKRVEFEMELEGDWKLIKWGE